jgi:hypothetical protein
MSKPGKNCLLLFPPKSFEIQKRVLSERHQNGPEKDGHRLPKRRSLGDLAFGARRIPAELTSRSL